MLLSSQDEFCTFMYLELHERDDAETRAKKVCMNNSVNSQLVNVDKVGIDNVRN